MITSESRTLRAIRWRARAPRLALYLAAGVLSLAGIRAIAAPSQPAPVAPPATAPVDLEAHALAERFARAYLTWDARHPERREARLSRLMSSQLDPDAGLVPADGSQQTVDWTTVAASRLAGPRRKVVTVAASTSAGMRHLAVPVERDARDLLFVSAYPALVGPPPITRAAVASEEPDVEDGQLRRVATRAARNYLARDAADLRADLAPDAVVSLPGERLRLRSVDRVTWAERPDAVAVEVQASSADGGLWTLRYELAVAKRERWYVRAVGGRVSVASPLG